jgi:adenylate kinase
MTVLVLLGAPGAGKGTQAEVLSEKLGIPHVATGDLFRAAVRDATPIGLQARRFMERGQLVPDDITIRMLLERLSKADAANGAILDGFPRNGAQAATLDTALEQDGGRVDRAVLIEVPDEELIRRMSGRWVCEEAGHVYNESTNPPLQAGICDIDGSALIQREDDKAETIRARLDLQLASLREVIYHYAATGNLRRVDGLQAIDDVSEDLLAEVSDLMTRGDA